MKNLLSAWALASVVVFSAAAGSSSASSASTGDLNNLRAYDTPSDGGESVTLEWESDAGVFVTIMRSTSADGEFEPAGETIASEGVYLDYNVEGDTGAEYFYRLRFVTGTDTSLTAVAGPAAARSNWFRTYRINALVLFGLMFALVVFYVDAAKKGKKLYIRKIPGLNAIDEAVGRATEMGKKMLYIPGILSLSEIQTIASLSILGYVAKLAAVYGAELEVPNIDPLTFSAARENVKQAYLEAGKPDQFKEDTVTYITYDQFAYAAAVTGKMVRERPATNFLIGAFFAESLILAETGQSTGAIQIAGTSYVTQLPFFVTTCDYTLMGEELFAASAYLSREPTLLGSIKAQDITKAILIIIMFLGIILLAFNLDVIRPLLRAQ
ncbi:MAG: hypothetical protein PVF95_02740 [bacterium]|jgi:hypothetical protein